MTGHAQECQGLPQQHSKFLEDQGRAHKITPNGDTDLDQPQLFAKAKKCEFYLPEINLLGVKVSAQGFRMEEKKVTEVQEWKPP